MFKVGDKVRIVRKVEQEEGWDNVWVKRMDRFIDPDHIRTVCWVDSSSGVGVEGAMYNYPPGALELVEAAPEVFELDDPVMVRHDKYDVWCKRHYAGTDEEGRYLAWECGCTSFTTTTKVTWGECRRPTPEELKGA